MDPGALYSLSTDGPKVDNPGSKLKSLINLKTIDFSHNRMTHICIDDLLNLEDLERY